MSSDNLAISVKNLSKRYEIFDRPGDRLKQFIIPRVRKIFGLANHDYFKDFWALSDISFDIKRGETIGIIGKNGSGKSTLLQIICGTLNPTRGDIKVKGRVAALLELGSGFNSEFTGRENIYMNAAILGLSNQEIKKRYHDIVNFADIGDFIDQPVKNYSSGMVVRLAFAVIAHVDADILVIDEALSVGDVIFTQKCMAFIKKFQKNGSLLFVSHDTGAILNLCQRAIFIDKGQIVFKGKAEEVVQRYGQFVMQEIIGDDFKLNSIDKLHSNKVAIENNLPIDESTKISFYPQIHKSSGYETGYAKLLSVELFNSSGEKINFFLGGESLTIILFGEVYKDLESPILGWFVKDKLGQILFGENTYKYNTKPKLVKAGGKIKASFTFKLPLLPNGDYSITASIANGDPFNHIQHHWLNDALVIKVASNVLRYGLVGIPFDDVKFEIT
jgi:lipopolysaccharide transport system ATP-binding protein